MNLAPDGELLLTAFHQHKRDGNKVMESLATALERMSKPKRIVRDPKTGKALGVKRTEVAIKFIPADSVQAEAQLVQWAASTALVHGRQSYLALRRFAAAPTIQPAQRAALLRAAEAATTSTPAAHSPSSEMKPWQRAPPPRSARSSSG